jgi:hypothetical protein
MKRKKLIIHVNQHNIKYNSKHEDKKPVLSVKCGKKNTYGNEVLIEGPSRIVYSPDKPLSCGAKVWLETYDNVIVLEESSK